MACVSQHEWVIMHNVLLLLRFISCGHVSPGLYDVLVFVMYACVTRALLARCKTEPLWTVMTCVVPDGSAYNNTCNMFEMMQNAS